MIKLASQIVFHQETEGVMICDDGIHMLQWTLWW